MNFSSMQTMDEGLHIYTSRAFTIMNTVLKIVCFFLYLPSYQKDNTFNIYVAFSVFNTFLIGNNHMSYEGYSYCIRNHTQTCSWNGNPFCTEQLSKSILKSKRGRAIYDLVYILDQYLNVLCKFAIFLS